MGKNQTIHQMRLEWLKKFNVGQQFYDNILAECSTEKEEAFFNRCKAESQDRLLWLITGLASLDMDSKEFKKD